MALDPQSPGPDILKTLVSNLKNQLFIFAIASVIALSLFGAGISGGLFYAEARLCFWWFYS